MSPVSCNLASKLHSLQTKLFYSLFFTGAVSDFHTKVAWKALFVHPIAPEKERQFKQRRKQQQTPRHFFLHMDESSQLKPLFLALRGNERICIQDAEGGYSLVC